jgi:two-component system, NtrC family, response regulator HydG
MAGINNKIPSNKSNMPEKKTILVVDDDNYICNILKKYLEQKGFIVETTYSGTGAKTMIDKNNFDLVLCDYRLPDNDGLSILKHIKSKNLPFR